MNAPLKPDSGLEGQNASSLLDVLIRAGLIFALATLCYRIFSPFLTLTVWAVILAVAMYPLHQRLAYRLGGKQGLAATLIVLVGVVLIVAPTGLLLGSLGDAAQEFVRRRPGQHRADSGSAPGCGRMADRRQEDPCVLVEGTLRPSGARAEHAAEDR